MNVKGFEFAMSAAIEIVVRRDPELVVSTASLPGLALLKILSWDDAYPARGKDAG
jgi:predicted nucleotidyltransferase